MLNITTMVVYICIRTQNAIISRFPIDSIRHTQLARKSEYIYFLSVDFKIHFLAQSMIYLLAHLFVCWMQLDLCTKFPMYSISKMYMHGYKCARCSSKSSITFSGSPARLRIPFQLNVSILSVQERSLSQLAIGTEKVCDLFISEKLFPYQSPFC